MPAQPPSGSRPIMVDPLAGVSTLAHLLTDPDRDHPVVLVSVPPSRTAVALNLDQFCAEVPTAVPVFVIPDDHTADKLIDLVGKELAVFGGAVRTVPPASCRDKVWLRRSVHFNTAEALAEAVLADVDVAVRLAAEDCGGAAPIPSLVDTESAAAQLGAYLLDRNRQGVVTLVTRPSGAKAALVDVDAVRSQVGDLAEVFEVCNGRVGLRLSRIMRDFSVYGGACRAYPPRDDWNEDPNRLPIRFVWSRADADNATRAIVSDTLRAAGRIRHSAITTSSPGGASSVTGTVIGIAGGSALVALAGGGNAMIRPELVSDGLSAEQLFRAGMAVSGQLDRSSGRLDISGAVRDATEALSGYTAGCVIACRVAHVEDGHAGLELFPGVVVRVERDDIVEPGRTTSLSELLAVGEGVAAVVTATPVDGGWALSLRTIEPGTTPTAAPSILSGGPAWITAVDVTLDVEPEPEPELEVEPEDLPEAEPTAAIEDMVPAAALASMRAERDQLLAHARRMEAAATHHDGLAAKHRARVRELESELAAAARRIGKAGRAVELVEAEGALFADAEEQLRFEVMLAWARRIPAGEKASKPLGQYRIGPEFIETLTSTDGIERSKVVDVMVEVACGLAWSIAGRELHQLRTGEHGDAPGRVRADGATCWRTSLQVNAASARRLHYWMLNDGTVEFSSVRLHDDMRS